ncbi:MAG: hypothetical protein HC902_11505 [Calothrix sp. SM1_5_4]|nr:hypothetical protein [Calothrix sp. SM1_5_4]
MDGFLGYSYSDRFSLENTWRNVSLALTYTNGGFTDDGRVSLWFIDQYRRILMLAMNYAFEDEMKHVALALSLALLVSGLHREGEAPCRA